MIFAKSCRKLRINVLFKEKTEEVSEKICTTPPLSDVLVIT